MDPDIPLNVASTSGEAIGRDMSNFADFPFYYGRKPIRYWSVESFYQALTQSDEKVRKTIAKMPGKQAKRAGSSQSTGTKFDPHFLLDKEDGIGSACQRNATQLLKKGEPHEKAKAAWVAGDVVSVSFVHPRSVCWPAGGLLHDAVSAGM